MSGVDFKVGDRVRLKDTFIVPRMHPDGQAHGWYHLSLTLVAGARATVKDIGEATLLVVFDVERRIDPYTVIIDKFIASPGSHPFRMAATLFEPA